MRRTRVVAVDALAPDAAAVAEARAVLRRGGLVAFPTETVYGLGAAALDAAAVARVFAAKGRPADNPLIVHLADAGELGAVTRCVGPLARTLAAAFWPGPLTLVLDAAPVVPPVVRGGLPTVGVRVPGHAVARVLAGGLAVAAPSANRSGRPSPTTAADVLADLDGRIDLVLDGGPCPVGLESTVVDARGAVPLVLREGAVTREQLAAAVGAPAVGTADAAGASPGTRHAHYRPACAVVLVAAGEGAAEAARRVADGARVGLVAGAAAPPGVVGIALHHGAEDLARRLYRCLRDADAAGLDALVVEAVPEVGIGRAVMDRLRRAAGGPGT